jgi:glutamate-5-semialdehyde dehydrogenase
VLKHLDGICHLYIHSDADPAMAIDLAVNAKTHRYGTCNTMESLLIDSQCTALLPELARSLLDKGVVLRGCEQTCAYLGEDCSLASEEDWATEYLAPILSIKVVEDLTLLSITLRGLAQATRMASLPSVIVVRCDF